MSKKIQCKKAGKRAQFCTSSKFRQKVFLHKRQVISQNNCGFAAAKKIVICFAMLGAMSAAFFVFGNLAQAQEKSWHFEKWFVDIQINQNSTFLVRETQTVNFQGNYHWFGRDISKKDLRQISNVKVFDETGRQLTGDEIEIKSQSNQTSVKINFDVTDATKTWTFEYLVHGGLRFFKDHDELYWNAVSSARDVVIDEVEVLAHLSQPIDSSRVQQRILLGALGSKQESPNWTFLSDNQTFSFWGQNILPGENFTIVAGWPRGIVQQSWLDKYSFYLNWLWLLLPVIVFIWLLRRWYQYGREPKLKGTIVAQYEPPQDLSPAEMAVVLHQRIKPQDISATIIDLAYRGYLKIVEQPEKKLFGEKINYQFIQQKPFGIDAILKDHELILLQEIFKSEKIVNLQDLNNKFYRQVPRIIKTIFIQATQANYFKRNPQKMINQYALIGVIVFGVGLVLFRILYGFWGAQSGTLPLVGFLISGMLVMVFARLMPSLSAKGGQAKWYALGFKEYLQVAERFRLQDLPPENFEKYLSYAMVLGVEKQWANRFVDIYHQPPDWYVPAHGYGYAAFSAIDFTHSLNSAMSSFNTALFSSPGGGSSGFGGGGGAGGGGGGGGSSAG